MGGGKDHKYLLRLIAIKVLEGTPIYIHRKMQIGETYFFYHGYEIDENDKITYTEEAKEVPYDFYTRFTKKNCPNITINAIVGCNGSGKSSIIEVLIRTLNNIGVAYIGECYTNRVSEHLHFVHELHSKLYFQLDNKYYLAHIDGDFVKIINVKNSRTLFQAKPVCFKTKEDDKKTANLFASKLNESHSLNLSKLFYTLISNYSLYAYNTNDFPYEITKPSDEEFIRIKEELPINKLTINDRCWIKGLFHKNDAYNTPIVLTPFRDEGNINVQSEFSLAMERLISLMVFDKNYRTINNHLVVDTLLLKVKGTSEREIAAKDGGDYEFNIICEKFNFKKKEAKDNYTKYRNETIYLWKKILAIKTNELSTNWLKEYAWDYIVYKTLKISYNYPNYQYFFTSCDKDTMEYDSNKLSRLVGELATEDTHITRKIWRTFAHLKYNYYQANAQVCGTYHHSFANIAKKINSGAKSGVSIGCHRLSREDLLPSPIFDTELLFKDLDGDNKKIPLSSLSSGERQLAFLVSSFIYHLNNIDSAHKTKGNRIKYSYVNGIFEEVELYFHPDMQRRFVNGLIDGIKQATLTHLKCISICLITHSPFVLSDIPRQNIMFLNEKGGYEKGDKYKSFGANIHEMLRSSFFMHNGTIGEYAKSFINDLISRIKNNTKDSESDPNAIVRDIQLVDEPLLKKYLYDIFNEYFEYAKKQRIQLLEDEINKIKKN